MLTREQQEEQARVWDVITSELEPFSHDERRRVRWVLSRETWDYLRELFPPPPPFWPEGDPNLIMGLPIRLDDSAEGVHAELVDAP